MTLLLLWLLFAPETQAATERPLAIVACFLPKTSEDAQNCAAIGKQLHEAGYVVRVEPMDGKSGEEAAKIVPAEGDPLVVVVGHGLVRNDRHQLQLNDGKFTDSAKFLKTMEQRNPNVRLWFESCFAGHLAKDANPKTCIGTGCRGDEYNYFFTGRPSLTFEPLLDLMAMPGGVFFERYGTCEITAPILREAYEAAFGDGWKLDASCTVPLFPPETVKALTVRGRPLRAYIDEDKTPVKPEPPSSTVKVLTGTLPKPLASFSVERARQACENGALKGSVLRMPTEYRFIAACSANGTTVYKALNGYFASRTLAQPYAAGCTILDTPLEEKLRGEVGGSKVYRNGGRTLVMGKLPSAPKNTVPFDEARDKYVGSSPTDKVTSPKPRQDWLGLWRMQPAIEGYATPWIDQFSVRHVGCEVERSRTPGVSAKTGLRWREQDANSDQLPSKKTH